LREVAAHGLVRRVCGLDAPPWAGAHGSEVSMKRSGSQKRRVTAQIKINCLPEQKAKVIAIAEKRGYSPSVLCLNTLLNEPINPARRQPPPNNRAVAQYLGALGKAADAIKSSEAGLGKANSNVNQIAHVLNAGRPPDRVMNLLESVLAEHLEAQRLHNEAIRDLLELRLAGLQALGFERNRKVRRERGETADD
jgi:hypothetical protein